MIDSTNPTKEVPEVAFLKKEKKRMVFRLDKSASEIVELLKHPRFEDNIKYTFEKYRYIYICHYEDTIQAWQASSCELQTLV